MQAIINLIRWFIRGGMTPVKGIVGAMILMVVFIFIEKGATLVQHNSAEQLQVKQNWWDGEQSVRASAGYYGRYWGKVWTYDKERSFEFREPKPEDKKDSDDHGTAAQVRFNDGGIGWVSLAFRYAYPLNNVQMKEINRLFMDRDGDDPDDAFYEEGAKQVVNKALIISAALISTKESYTTHKAQFGQYALDQIQDGIYDIKVNRVTRYDSTRKEYLVEYHPEIVTDPNTGQIKREPSYFRQLGIQVRQFNVIDITYESDVDNLIAQSREFQTMIQAAQAAAQKAEQDRLTAEAEGKRNVTKAEYEAKKNATRQVTSAHKDTTNWMIDARRELKLAQENFERAKDQVAGMIALARGQAEARRKEILADGALVKKKGALNAIMTVWSEAFKKKRVVPVVAYTDGTGTSNTVPGISMLEKIGRGVASDLGISFDFATFK